MPSSTTRHRAGKPSYPCVQCFMTFTHGVSLRSYCLSGRACTYIAAASCCRGRRSVVKMNAAFQTHLSRTWRSIESKQRPAGSAALRPAAPHVRRRFGCHARGPVQDVLTLEAGRRQQPQQEQREQVLGLPSAPQPEAVTDGLSSPASTNGPQATQGPAFQDDLVPKLLLLLAAVLWGSYAPSVRLLFSSPEPPEAVVVMGVRGSLQALVLLMASWAMQPPAQQAQQQEEGEQAQHLPLLLMAAGELGLWNFLATSLQTWGLQLTGATRATFLIQSTLLFTPLLSMLAGYRPARQVLAGCGLALAGSMLIIADEAAGGGIGAGSAEMVLGGDAAVLLAALFYSLGVVRVGRYAQALPPVQLATGKSVVLGSLALFSLLFAAGHALQQGEGISALWNGWAEPSSWGSWIALGWSGVGPGALASYLHVKGQRSVAPAEAQVIFSSKPLWAAGLAWVLLGGEELGPLTWVGGSTLVAAGLIASAAPQQAAQLQQQAAQLQQQAQQQGGLWRLGGWRPRLPFVRSG